MKSLLLFAVAAMMLLVLTVGCVGCGPETKVSSHTKTVTETEPVEVP